MSVERQTGKAETDSSENRIIRQTKIKKERREKQREEHTRLRT